MNLRQFRMGSFGWEDLRKVRAAVVFVMTAIATTVAWEYGFEAWIEHPSAQDLLITSTTGSVLGELSYRATRKMERNGFHGWEKPALALVNPVWILQRGFSVSSAQRCPAGC